MTDMRRDSIIMHSFGMPFKFPNHMDYKSNELRMLKETINLAGMRWDSIKVAPPLGKRRE